MKPIIEARAKENLVTHTDKGYQGFQNSEKAVDTRKELAKIAGVSHDTVAKVEKIEKNALEPVKRVGEFPKQVTIIIQRKNPLYSAGIFKCFLLLPLVEGPLGRPS